MQRVQQIKLLIIAAVALSVSACQQEKNITVAEYLHDIDYTQQQLAIFRNDLGKYENNPNYRNAVEANQLTQGLLHCWPEKQGSYHIVTTATTDHQCLDKAGYKR